MSVQHALTLIQKLRSNAIVIPATATPFSELVQLGAEHGLNCTQEELRKAFVLDWQMRWAKTQGRMNAIVTQ